MEQAVSERVRQRYASRLESQRTTSDGPVIGVVGGDVPLEIIESCGARAYRLSAVDRPADATAVGLLGGAVDAAAHSILEQILAGDFDFLRGLVISRDSQASLRLFYVLRALAAQGRDLPPIHLVDIQHLRRDSTERYNRSRLAKFGATVAQWTGRPYTIESLRTAGAARTLLAHSLRQLRERRCAADPTVSGATALRLYALSQTAPPEEAVALIDSVLADPEPMTNRLRVFLTGSTHDHDGDYVALESMGCQVVGEDHSWGDPFVDFWTELEDIPDLDAAHAAIASHRLYAGAMAQTSGLSERARYTAACARRARADVVLSLVRRNDPAPGWDYPALVRELDGRVRTEKLTGATYTWPRAELAAVLARPAAEENETATR
ncbi:2-hydroxyacyl-CoA dehydratase family protein [Nocardia sp. NBC_00416]|uniref:2-hydroxyacyl-CoA dehydratase family protein n=1 Tax=Nocardia sp. NBC_00416 TaxID=2975991 RepID=UPI002E21F897